VILIQFLKGVSNKSSPIFIQQIYAQHAQYTTKWEALWTMEVKNENNNTVWRVLVLVLGCVLLKS
jgi:hypothetical protein